MSTLGQNLNEGDVITKLNNTSCNDIMSLKEARKIIDGCKEKLNLVVFRESRTFNNTSNFLDQTYNNNYGNLNKPRYFTKSYFITKLKAIKNAFLGADIQNSYSGQNLYVAPPSRSTLIGDNNINNSAIGNNHLAGSGNNVVNGGRTRGPLSMSQEISSSPHQHNHPPRPPPPRPEGIY